MFLERIIGTKTKVNMLATLIEHSEGVLLEKELAQKSGSSLSEVNRQITDLVTSGLVKAQRIARNKTYQINRHHFLYKPLKDLFLELEEVYRQAAKDLADFASESGETSCVLLSGSLADGRIRDDIVHSPSDIDIVFIVKRQGDVLSLRKSLIEYINSEIGLRYGIAVYPIVLSMKQYRERILTDPFFMQIHGGGEVILGKKPRRAGGVGAGKG